MDYNLQVLLAKIIFVHLKEVKYCVDLCYIYIYMFGVWTPWIVKVLVWAACCPQLLLKACVVSVLPLILQQEDLDSIASRLLKRNHLAKDITECIH